MTATLDKDSSNPVVVDETFLRELERRLRNCLPLIEQQLADRYEVSPNVLTEWLAGGERPSGGDGVHYDSVLAACRVEYTITWTNDITTNVAGVEAALDALSLEYARPTRIKAEIGKYPEALITVTIKDGLYTRNINVKAPLKDVKIIFDPIDNLFKSSTPDFSILHHPLITLLITPFWVLWAIVFSEVAYDIGHQGVTGPHGAWHAVAFVVAGIAGFVLMASYRKAFPAVVFEFGVGKRQKLAKRVVLGTFLLLISSVLIPHLMP